MSFEQALAYIPSEAFNTAGLRECLRDMALRGCFLSPNREALPPIREGGIAYHVMLDFNRLDQLTDITLSFDREDQITRSECLDIHARSIDWLVERYGRFAHSKRDDRSKGWRDREITSPGGNKISFAEEVGDGDFITYSDRNIARTTPAVPSGPIKQRSADGYVWLLSHALTIGNDVQCSVNIKFSGPESVERRRDPPIPTSKPPEVEQSREKVGPEETAEQADSEDTGHPSFESTTDEVPVCDQPDSPSKRALMNEIGVTCDPH